MNTKNECKHLMSFLKKDKISLAKYIFGGIIVSFSQTATNLLISFLFGAVATLNTKNFLIYLGGLFIFAFIEPIMYFVSRKLRIKFMRDKLLEIRELAFKKIMNKSFKEFSSVSKDVYISNLTNDINSIENTLFLSIVNMIFLLSVIVSSFAIILITDFASGALIIALTAVFYFFMKIFESKTQKIQKDISSENEIFTIKSSNTINGSEIIKLSNLEDTFIEKMHNSSESLEKQKFILNNFKGFVEAQSTIFQILLTITIIGVLLFRGMGTNNLTKMLILINMGQSTLWPLKEFFVHLNTFKSHCVIFNKICIEENTSEKESFVDNFSFKKKIILKNIKLSFNNKMIFSNVNLEILKGKKYKIKGESGSGKSSLLKIFSLENSDYSGEYLIDGLNAKNIDSESFFNNVALVFQDVYLFEDSIRNNISLYNDYSDEEIIKAANLSGIKNLIDEYSLDYILEENGKNLSGGQRQRISIARAIIKNSDLLLVDEATSSLDEETAKQIEETLLNIDATVIAVSHRNHESLIGEYDAIINIESGIVKMEYNNENANK